MALLRRGTKYTVQLGDEVVVLSRRASKQATKAEKEMGRATEAERKAAEKEAEIAELEAGGAGAADPLTGAKIKRYIGIARVVVPVVAPLAYQAVGSVRARWDTHRARQLGVAPDELGDFTGRGAALYARIHNIALAVRDLRTRRGDADADDAREVRAFADDTEARLADLEAAVRASEQMPSARRRRAHEAAGSELDRIESGVLERRGLRVTGGPGTAQGGRGAVRAPGN